MENSQSQSCGAKVIEKVAWIVTAGVLVLVAVGFLLSLHFHVFVLEYTICSAGDAAIRSVCLGEGGGMYREGSSGNNIIYR